ncbi:hypothetical protein BDR26DRAFT_824045 [Obelidium mucronatum]|nr:hypothetical protein BDR26DRAFT_824045 [Obelidium mucronatum]
MFEEINAGIQPPPVEPPPPPPPPPAAKQKAKRKKVSQACVFCRRSHMTCDEGRPCQRCIRRKIAHLCTNEALPKPDAGCDASPAAAVQQQQQQQIQNLYAAPMTAFTTNQHAQSLGLATGLSQVLGNVAGAANNNTTRLPHGLSSENLFPPLFAGGDPMGNELTIISDFLASLESPATASSSSMSTIPAPVIRTPVAAPAATNSTSRLGRSNSVSNSSVTSETAAAKVTVPQTESLSSTERFVLTAADPMTIGTNEDRLNQVISAKFEAGLLKPYNYINSYKKLNTWMETHMSPASRTRILNVMGLFRPRFQWVAQRLTDMDLVLVEEAFERMLLEYDRVFSSMGIPSCLWRRTGEIWKCNKEFAELVGLPMDELKDGKLSIYELMSEESAVNYWEKYGNIAFDAGQKAILTSCILKKPDDDGAPAAAQTQQREGVSCCFSFTIRRDRYSIPIIIAGNFLPVMGE